MTGVGRAAPGGELGVAGQLSAAVNAEWTKIRTVRGPRWNLLAGLVATVALGALLSYFMGRNYSPPAGAPFEPVRTAFGGLVLGQLAMVVLGVMLIGGEYTSGMIRLSLAAVPNRGVFYLAKATVLGAVTLAVGLVTAFTAFFVGQALLDGHGVSLGDPGVLRAVLVGALYPTLISLFALGVATMLRRQTLALGILIPFFFLVSTILQAIPGVTRATQFLPDQAGQRALQIHHQTKDAFGPLTGLLITVLWVAASLLGGWLVLRRRDA
ncbi:ABC transporter permease [Streptacidiphilus carbonis]|uniref:ABC transporter permease n=1 Tax=Streptacidiphilus carbonis TaxID=105422 RepID=UPI0005A99C09